MRRIVSYLVVAILIAAAAFAGGILRLKQWAVETATVPNEVVVDFKSGTTLGALSRSLATNGVVSSAAMFQAYVRVTGSYRQFQAGQYRFSGTLTPTQVADVIRKGETYTPVVLTITIPEGFTLKQTLDRLAANGAGTLPELRKLASNPRFLQKLSIHAKTIEGYLYPATYGFQVLPTAAEALEQMTKTFWQHLPKDYEIRVNRLGLSLNEAITFASLIELETMFDDEKTLISEVIWRRLKDKVPLGIDAAIIYGIPDYAGDLKWVHLQDATNPYNTRIHAGLPPSPIGSPSRKSLEAVLTPANFGYYYYVLMPGQTRHKFSRTLKEHNEAVKKLLKKTK